MAIAARPSLLSIEPVFFLALAALLFGLLQLGVEIPLGGGSPQFVISHGFQFEIGLLLVALAGASIVLRQAGTSFAAELRSLTLPRFERPSLWLLATVALAAAIGGCLLDQPMRYDEAFTALFFVDASWPAAFYYPLPNNHFAYTVLERLMPGDSPAWLRLPALLAWLGSIAVVSRACQQLGSSGHLAAVGMAVTPFMVLYGTSARGYTLTVLLTALIVLSVARQRINGVALGAFSAAGLFVMPSMLYALAGLGLWALIVVGGRWRELVPWGAFTTLFTTLLYLPVLLVNRAGTIAANRFFARVDDFGPAALTHMTQTIVHFARDVPAIALAALAVLVVTGLVVAFRARRWAVVALLPAVLAGAGVVFLAQQGIPFPRTWIFLVPLALIVADAGWTALAGKRGLHAWLLLAAAVLVGWQLVANQTIEKYPDTGVAPDARAMAARIAPIVAGTDWICARPPVDALVRYYLQRDFPIRMGTPAAAQVFYVGEPPALPVALAAEVGALRVYRLTQPQPVQVFSKHRTCWLRGGHFFG